MPDIKCDYGHVQSIGTDEWLGTLTLDQLRYARDQAATKIKAAEEQPFRTVWRVVIDDCIIDGNYREEDHDKAAAHLLRIYADAFAKEAARFIESPYSTYTFNKQLPRVDALRVSQMEYETEWFPAK